MSIKDIIAPFAVWKRVFEKPYTVPRPLDQRPGAQRYRGFHMNDVSACIGCGTCETICQNEAIDLVPADGEKTRHGDSGLRPMVDYGRCCWCALCVDACPTGSLGMSNEYQWVSDDPEVFRYIPGKDEKPWDGNRFGYNHDNRAPADAIADEASTDASDARLVDASTAAVDAQTAAGLVEQPTPTFDRGNGELAPRDRSERYVLLEKSRVGMPTLPPEEGVTGFRELVLGYSAEQARLEADRCVQCGLCTATCPAHMDVPGYIKSIIDDDLPAGMRTVYDANPLPASCGRVCSHACEYVCSKGHDGGEPISIRWLKRYIVDQIYSEQYASILRGPEAENGKRVAVIGSGPGGLAAAYYLRLLGYAITVFDARDLPGGMLRYGIPEYRLPYDQISKDIDYISSLGVDVRQNVTIGADVSFDELYARFDAIFFSTGLPNPYLMNVPGEDHPRVLAGLAVLDDVTKGRDPGVGARVAVIGGGNVAMDAARTSRRFGAEVTILYRRRVVDMPADDEEVHEALEESVTIVPQAIPVRIEDADDGKVSITWGEARLEEDPSGGRPRPVLQEDRLHTEIYDSIISAIGQDADYSFLPEAFLDRVRVERGKVATNELKQTGDPKIFAGGDIVNRKRDAISAIGDGHQAARGIDRYLLDRNRTAGRI
jgi:glutamate synthase (NADPH/NADH) small chain